MFKTVKLFGNESVSKVVNVLCLSLQRNINVSKVPDKETLVQLAYQHTVPRPQRKYRSNRRGRAMTAKQQKRTATLNRLNYTDTKSANQTYIMYVHVLVVTLFCILNRDSIFT